MPNCSTPDCENKSVMWSGLTICWTCGEWVYGHEFMVALFNANHPWTYEEAGD